ncbi:MAG: hypothetical protein KIT35_07950 [Piscinibacter sp.]|nr:MULTISPECIES: hypothetical protein [Piscinibacter]MCW5663752.1 hypothetical protein [Piscinibacter sp.]
MRKHHHQGGEGDGQGPGHYDAGMKGLVNVAQKAGATKIDGHGSHKR